MYWVRSSWVTEGSQACFPAPLKADRYANTVPTIAVTYTHY
jgi:hypothetical protein